MNADPIDDVPVFVDTDIRAREFPFVRCSYLTVERDEPDPSWWLNMDGRHMSFMLVHLSGVIFQSLDGSRFTTPDLVEELISTIEREERLSVDVADVWVPNFLFQFRPEAGAVFRVRRRLFIHAFGYRNGFLDEEAFVTQAREERRGIEFSEDETGSFRIWHERQVNLAKEFFPKNPNTVLYPREREREQ